jgi:hypothetical protein
LVIATTTVWMLRTSVPPAGSILTAVQLVTRTTDLLVEEFPAMLDVGWHFGPARHVDSPPIAWVVDPQQAA